MLSIIYLAIISIAADAAVIAKRNQSDEMTYSVVNAVIGQNETTDIPKPGDNLDDGRTVKDTQIERSTSWKVERDPPEKNFYVTTQKMPLRRNISKALASGSKKHGMINDGFKVYFASDDEWSPTTRISKPVPEDDGKIYFEPMLQRKNTTRTPVKESESNIMRIEPSNGTIATTPATMEEVTLDNRNAFSADMPCNAGQSKVMGKCVDPE